tara:strand:- start:915 stop:1877 length:963 start_codon:yes stop_codon:yes gene_type:complete
MNNNLSLVEKYRPNSLKNIIGQEDIIKSLQKCIQDKNIPHLLFYGNSGIGKTSIATILVKKLFKSKYKDRYLELNASDERGIKIVRDKIKNFAKYSINDNDKNDINFKIIILDEADALTIESQLALRYIIEYYSTRTRFILICNYINKIIEPILSRCVLYHFKNISKPKVIKLLKKINVNENLKLSLNILNNIYKCTSGDLRYAINILEKFSYFNNYNIYNIFNYVDEKYLHKIFNLFLTNKKQIILKEINNIFNNGYSAIEIIFNIKNIIINTEKLSDKQKAIILFELSKIDYNLNNRCNDYIQLLFLSRLIYNTYTNI